MAAPCCARSTRCAGIRERLTDSLEQWAKEAPERTFIAQRAAGGGDWITISYAQMLQRVRSVGQALVDLQLSVERPVAILSDNDIEHLTLALAAMWAGVPYAPVSQRLFAGLAGLRQAAPHRRHRDAGTGLRQRPGVCAGDPGGGRRRRDGGSRPKARSTAAHTRVVRQPARRRYRARRWPPRTTRSTPTASPSSCSPRARPRRRRA